MRATYQGRTGLFREHAGIAAPVYDDLRLTIPAREALEETGATVVRTGGPDGPTYCVTMGQRVPEHLVVTAIEGDHRHGLRLESEPEYPGEIRGHTSYWLRACFLGCPECGAPLAWYEAGYVPGYRVCTAGPHHHVMIR